MITNPYWLRLEAQLLAYAEYHGEATIGRLIALHAQHMLRVLPELMASQCLANIKPHLSHAALVLPLNETTRLCIVFEDGMFSVEQVSGDQTDWSKRLMPDDLIRELENFIHIVPQP